MLRASFLLALIIPLASSLLKAQTPPSPLPGPTVARRYTPPPPGLLETFLEVTPKATVLRRNLGDLTAADGASAQFIAIVASDPSHPGNEAKGIEVLLSEGKRKKTTYLDYDRYPDGRSDSLSVLARDLTNLDQREGQRFKPGLVARKAAAGSGGLVFREVTTGAFDRPAYLPTWCCPRFIQLDLGLYRRGGIVGVIMIAPTAKPGTATYLFPGSGLGEVVNLIRAGRQFILSH